MELIVYPVAEFMNSTYTWFKNGRDDINDERHVVSPKFMISADSMRTVHEFISDQP